MEKKLDEINEKFDYENILDKISNMGLFGKVSKTIQKFVKQIGNNKNESNVIQQKITEIAKNVSYLIDENNEKTRSF